MAKPSFIHALTAKARKLYKALDQYELKAMLNQSQSDQHILDDDDLSARVLWRVRTRTLILLRWLAIAGQALCILGVHYGLEFELPLGLCSSLIVLSILVNLGLSWNLTSRRFASDGEAFGQLAFDAGQLMALLALTGGLLNPFSIMLMGPVVVAIAALPARLWISLSLFVLTGSILISFWHLPLPWFEGQPFIIPPLYQSGIWIALAIAIGFTAIYAWRIGLEARRMGMALTATQNVLVREQHMSSIGALAAAAAHELGTPLATIQLSAKELHREAKDDLIREDAALIMSQAERCRDILLRLSKISQASDQIHDRIDLEQLIEEAAMPLRGIGAQIHIASVHPDQAPILTRRAELIYALGNFIENAVDFARTKVELSSHWDEDTITLSVEDDGPGFRADILAKLGEPYITTRRAEPGYGGMGLGVFIAITLTERLGGHVLFSNTPGSGARVDLILNRHALRAEPLDGASDLMQ